MMAGSVLTAIIQTVLVGLIAAGLIRWLWQYTVLWIGLACVIFPVRQSLRDKVLQLGHHLHAEFAAVVAFLLMVVATPMLLTLVHGGQVVLFRIMVVLFALVLLEAILFPLMRRLAWTIGRSGGRVDPNNDFKDFFSGRVGF